MDLGKIMDMGIHDSLTEKEGINLRRAELQFD